MFTLEVQSTVVAVKLNVLTEHTDLQLEKIYVSLPFGFGGSHVEWFVTSLVPKLKSNWATSAFSLSLNFTPVLQVGKLRIRKKVSVKTEVTTEKLLTLSPPHMLG